MRPNPPVGHRRDRRAHQAAPTPAGSARPRRGSCRRRRRAPCRVADRRRWRSRCRAGRTLRARASRARAGSVRVGHVAGHLDDLDAELAALVGGGRQRVGVAGVEHEIAARVWPAPARVPRPSPFDAAVTTAARPRNPRSMRRTLFGHDGAMDLLVDGVDFGEGPRWHDGELWYSDFFQHTIYAVTPSGERRAVWADLPDRPVRARAGCPTDRCSSVAEFTRSVLREQDGELVEHADLSTFATGHCNDMVVAADGTAYVGNFGFDMESGEPPKNADLVRRSTRWNRQRCRGQPALSQRLGHHARRSNADRRRDLGRGLRGVHDRGGRIAVRSAPVGRHARHVPRRLHV